MKIDPAGLGLGVSELVVFRFGDDGDDRGGGSGGWRGSEGRGRE